jgi:uncharacterized membrane protein YeaQ/YmgE (transglycosylase-associated protein family)
MQFSAQTKSWILLICTATASGIAAASIASKGGCDTIWTIIAGIGGAVTAVSHALMTSPQNAQMVQESKARDNIGNP